MIRLIYWLIKRRWAICTQCKHFRYVTAAPSSWAYQCNLYSTEHHDYITGNTTKEIAYCHVENQNGVCWGFLDNRPSSR
jgi:hypothetical protein